MKKVVKISIEFILLGVSIGGLIGSLLTLLEQIPK